MMDKTGKKIVLLDNDIMEVIDNNRGGMSRADFIERYLADSIEKRQEKPQPEPQAMQQPVKETVSNYITREDFLDFQHKTNKLIETLIDTLGERDLDTARPRPAAHRQLREEDELLRIKETLERFSRREPVYKREDTTPRPARETRSQAEPEPAYAPPAAPQATVQAGTRSQEPLSHEENRLSEEEASLSQKLKKIAGQVKGLFGTDKKIEPAKPALEPMPSRDDRDRGYRQHDHPYNEASVRAIDADYDRRHREEYHRTYNESHREALLREEREERRREELRCIENTQKVQESSQNMYLYLWIPAILLFGFFDTFLSTMVFGSGGYEVNPLMGGLVTMLGGSLLAFVFVKTVVMVVLGIISFKYFRNAGWVIPGLLIVAGAILTISNLNAYMKLT